MMMATTKLEAVNIILASIGADPVNTIDAEADVDVANALRILDYTSRNIQRKGWDFNQGTFELKPDKTTKKIRINPTIISFKATDGGQYSTRSGFLFDMVNRTNEFDKPVQAEITVALDFEDLPDAFKNYIAIKAATDYQMQYMADASLSQDLQQQLLEAQSDLVSYDMNMGSYNMLNLTSIANTLQRS